MADRKRGGHAGQSRKSRLDFIKQAMQDPTEAQPDCQQRRGNGDLLEVSNSEGVSFGGRSEGQPSDISSNLFRPRWGRLLQAAGQILASKVQGTETSAMMGAVFDPGAGGGTEKDITHCLKTSLEALDLNDEDTGYVLVSAYHFLQASDLKLSVKTWRCLLTVALMAGVRAVTNGSPEGIRAEERIKDSVVHWWPRPECEQAYQAFTTRKDFVGQLTPSIRADRYFELRDRALQMSYDTESVASAVMSFNNGKAGGNSFDHNSGRGSQRVPRRGSHSRAGLSESSQRSGNSGMLEYSDGESSGSWASNDLNAASAAGDRQAAARRTGPAPAAKAAPTAKAASGKKDAIISI